MPTIITSLRPGLSPSMQSQLCYARGYLHSIKYLVLFVFLSNISLGQTIDSVEVITDTLSNSTEKDVTDLFRKLGHHNGKLSLVEVQKDHAHFSLVPAVGYTLQTGFAIVLAANTVFYTEKNDHSKMSAVVASLTYSQYNQVILPVSADIWTEGGKYNVLSDFRYMSYPSKTFGLGDTTKNSDGYGIDFNYLKLHQSVLRKISSDLYGGLGYYLDLLWNVEEKDLPPGTVTDFQKYGLHDSETASGICFQILFDSRANQVNSTNGVYASIRHRVNSELVGSTSSWQATTIDLRKYVKFPAGSKNVLAVWNYNWFTMAGKAPYLLLPSIGWDDNFNTGRGYIQGRYRANNMSYLEFEYRFNLLRNGLIGAVVFSNLQTYSSQFSGLYNRLIPGGGLGLRLKVNKNSQTNLCFDYGFGEDGSRGFFINLGEVF